MVRRHDPPEYRKTKEAPGAASRPEGFSFVGRSVFVFGSLPDLQFALRFTFFQAADSASLYPVTAW